MLTDAMIEAIKLFNEEQPGSSATINVLLRFLQDWDEDEWELLSEAEKRDMASSYASKLYY